MLSLKGKKALMIIAPDKFRDEEFFEPKSVLEQAGVQVTTASKNVSEAVGMLSARAKVDIDIAIAAVENFDILIFVGGSGSSIYFNDEIALNLAKKAAFLNKIIGAICIAPSILANAGILQGKRATAFPTEEDNLKSKGAIFTNEQVTVDGKIITAKGPKAAQDFANKIIQTV